jgi:hypothetical protein
MSRSEAGKWFAVYTTPADADTEADPVRTRYAWSQFDRKEILQMLVEGTVYLEQWTDVDKVYLFDWLMKRDEKTV